MLFVRRILLRTIRAGLWVITVLQSSTVVVILVQAMVILLNRPDSFPWVSRLGLSRTFVPVVVLVYRIPRRLAGVIMTNPPIACLRSSLVVICSVNAAPLVLGAVMVRKLAGVVLKQPRRVLLR